ncbi:MAG TPA: HlyD family efflux transporter periplasmic adaptor subunit [Rhodanobacteraceae bacterium]
MDDLFREEAVLAQRLRQLGSIRLATPVSHQLWGAFAALASITIVAWLYFGHYTQRQHVAGALVPQAGLLSMTAPAAGTIASVAVTQGMHVRAGQVLLTVSADRGSAVTGHTYAAVGTQLEAQQVQLRATLAGLQPQAAAQARDMRARSLMLHHQLAQIDAQQALQRKQAATAMDLWQQAKPLHQRGIVSTLEFDQYKDQALTQREQVKALARQRLDITQQLSSLRAQLIELPIDTASKAHQLRGQLAQLTAALAQNAVQRQAVLRAPRAGTVSAVLIQPGQAVNPGQTLVSIMPQGSALLAQLLVPSSAIGFVHAGTPVVLHYQAFPYQKFGVQHGTVVQVSRNALTPTEITQLLGRSPPPEPLYRVRVRLAAQSIEAYGKRRALLPGMTVTADLMLDRRRMLEWIFEPLYGMARRATGKKS